MAFSGCQHDIDEGLTQSSSNDGWPESVIFSGQATVAKDGRFIARHRIHFVSMEMIAGLSSGSGLFSAGPGGDPPVHQNQ
jgi:hypothetical protein